MGNKPVLGALGISEFDERVYLLLLSEVDPGPSEIAVSVGASPSRVRRALARLSALGVVRRDTRGHYEPVSPDTALAALLNQRRLEVELAFTEVQSAVADLAHVHRAGQLRSDPDSLVEVLSGRETVDRRLEELSPAIRTHLWVLDKPPYRPMANGQPYTNEAETAETLAMMKRGVEVRSVYCPESMERPGRFETIVKLASLGEHSRLLPTLPFKLRIVDRRIALLPLVGEVYDSLAVIHPSGILDALIELFEVYWERAEPIAGGCPQPDDQPSESDLLILQMLKAGMKDQAIARQLGVSPRTATRRIAEIMADLGATTRFQAGVNAATRGWL